MNVSKSTIFICVESREITWCADSALRASKLPLSLPHNRSSSPSSQQDPPSQHVCVRRLSSARKDCPHHWGEFWYRRGEPHPNSQEDISSSSITGKATAILFAKVCASCPQLWLVALKHTLNRVVRMSFSLHAGWMPFEM